MPVCLAVAACGCARRGCDRPRRYPSDTADAEWALLAPLLPVEACQTPSARASRGWDNAKKVNGRKRHIAVGTTGLLLEVLITPASVQDLTAPARCCSTSSAPAAASAVPGPMPSTPANWSPGRPSG